MIGLLQAEWLKIKYRNFFWIIFSLGIAINVYSTVMYLIAPEAYAELGINPWNSYLSNNLSYFSLLVFPLATIFITAIVINIEQKADSWKMLLTLPIPRWQLVLTKLTIIFIVLVMIDLIFVSSIFILNIPIQLFHPEIEFYYFSPSVLTFISENLSLMISVMAIVSLQVFLCLSINNQIISISVGIVLWILGFILSVVLPSYATLFPYAFPMLYKDFGITEYITTSSIQNISYKSILITLIMFPLNYYVFSNKNK